MSVIGNQTNVTIVEQPVQVSGSLTATGSGVKYVQLDAVTASTTATLSTAYTFPAADSASFLYYLVTIKFVSGSSYLDATKSGVYIAGLSGAASVLAVTTNGIGFIANSSGSFYSRLSSSPGAVSGLVTGVSTTSSNAVSTHAIALPGEVLKLASGVGSASVQYQVTKVYAA